MIGNCAYPSRCSPSTSNRAPGLPATSACGSAQGEPRGHRGLDARFSAGGEPAEIALVRRGALQRRVRAMLIVPADQRGDQLPHRVAAEGKHTESRQLFLESFDGAFYDGDAAVLADSAPAGFDPVAPAPILVTGTSPKLATFVADEMARRRSRSVVSSSKKGAHLGGCRRIPKQRESRDPARVVVDDNPQPPTEWPPLRQCERSPRTPATEQRRNGGEVHVPDVVGALGGGDAALWPVSGTAASSGGPRHRDPTAGLRDARETCGRALGEVRRPAPSRGSRLRFRLL